MLWGIPSESVLMSLEISWNEHVRDDNFSVNFIIIKFLHNLSTNTFHIDIFKSFLFVLCLKTVLYLTF